MFFGLKNSRRRRHQLIAILVKICLFLFLFSGEIETRVKQKRVEYLDFCASWNNYQKEKRKRRHEHVRLKDYHGGGHVVANCLANIQKNKMGKGDVLYLELGDQKNWE